MSTMLELISSRETPAEPKIEGAVVLWCCDDVSDVRWMKLSQSDPAS